MSSTQNCTAEVGTDEDGDDDDGEPVQAALSNPLVLYQIWVCLPSKDLLHTCSLVNKFWNSQARTFLRDHREISVKIGPGFVKESVHVCETCNTLNNLCDAVSQMNIIPINHIHFNFPMSTSPKSPEVMLCRNSNTIENIFKIKLRTLSIVMKDIRLCCVSPQLLLELLRRNVDSLLNLKILGIPVLLEELLVDWVPQLPKLEWLTISGTDGNKSKLFHSNLLKRVPNVRSISLDGSLAPFVIPEARYYKLLNNFTVSMPSAEHRRKCLQVAEMRPTLQILSAIYHSHHDHSMLPSYSTVVQQLLDSSRDRLERLDIYFESNFRQFFLTLDLPTLKKVEFMSIRTKCNSEELLSVIAGFVSYSRTFPGLKDVRLTAGLSTPQNIAGDAQVGLDEQNDLNLMTHTCDTVSELWLDMRLGNRTLLQLKSTFPLVVRLHLHMSLSYEPPLWKVCQLWPGLEELALHGESLPRMCAQHDAQFCGISREEVDAYSDKDEGFLRALHIVPVRHCILTLPNLRRLTVEVDFIRSEAVTAAADDPSSPKEEFVSKVTECLVFQRLPLLKGSIKYDGYETSDSESDDDDAEDIQQSSDEEG